MLAICGYDFCGDGNAFNPSPLSVDTMTNVTLSGGSFNHWNVTADTNITNYDIPTTWDFLTIMDADFESNTEAGNVNESLAGIDSVVIKRRIVGEFNWITIKTIPIQDFPEDLTFIFNDNLCTNGVEYEYALIPVTAGTEGEYVTNSVTSTFNGVFICDATTIFKFYSGVAYGSETRNQNVGVFTPFGRKYPVVVANGLTDYSVGSVQGRILPNNYMTDKQMDRYEITTIKKSVLDFITNKKAKILKDWNGNSWLMIVTGSPSVSYDSNYGMGDISVNFAWTEIGDVNTQADLYNTGLVSEVE